MPVYRQEKKVVRYIGILDEVLAQLNLGYEIICVVDGMEDNTFQNAKNLNLPSLKVVGYEHNRGKGYAVHYGMNLARGNIIGFVDGGHDIKYSSIPLALEHMKWYNADIVVGSKRHPASKVAYPWQRRILSWGYQTGVRLLFGVNVRDTQVGMKFFRKKVIQRILSRLMIKQFAFDIEMLAVAKRHGFKRIYEFPVEISLEFSSSSIITKGFWRSVVSMLTDTLAVFYRLRILRYYDAKV